MKKKNLSTFARKILIFLIPIFILFIWYLNSDPFRVLHTYKYYENDPTELNQGYISWQSFLNNRDSLKYDSFLLGNSCTMAYPTTIWKPYIGNGSPIRLNASSESLYGIYKKVKRLDECGAPIKKALFLLDHSTLRKVIKNNKHSRILHPDVSGIGKLEFQKVFITAFFNPKFLIPYFDYCVFHKYRKYMRGIIMKQDDHRNQLTNDIINPREFEIEKLKEQYWVKHKNELPARTLHIEAYPQVIFNKQNKMLSEISEIFKKHETDYQIIINPEWSQKSLNKTDLTKLKNIFAADRIHNFSGKNKYTENKENYYEKSHYRPILGKLILQDIYKN